MLENNQKNPEIPKIPGNTRNTRKYPKVKKIPGNTWLLTKSSDMGRKGCGVENKNSSRTSEPDHLYERSHVLCSALHCSGDTEIKNQLIYERAKRSPIELHWTAKKHDLHCIGCSVDLL